MELPELILNQLPRLKLEVTPTLYDRMTDLISALAPLGKLEETSIGCSVDGACVHWTKKKIFCYLIEADEESDEIAELDGCYIVSHLVAGDEMQTDVAETLDDLLVLLQQLV